LVEESDTSQQESQEATPAPVRDTVDAVGDPQTEEAIKDPEIVELLRELPPEARGQAIRLVARFQYSGPLPPASELEAYERALPGSADRIVRMAEGEAEHRRAMESIVVSSGAKRASRGQVFAFVIALFVTAVGTAIILAGYSPQGLTLILVALGSLLGVFIAGRVSAARQLKRDSSDES